MPYVHGKAIVGLVVIAFTAISAWILGIRMRRRIRRALGINVESESELTSLNTWMKVEDAEERGKSGRLQ
jgi:hypothetical protein